jgi:hypothetical protein
LFLYNEGFLYLGIRASTTEMIVRNVYLDRGDEIAILHASAALGAAVYRREEESWRLARDFVWRCRDTGDSPAAQQEREAFLREQGWVAANSRVGTPHELEHQIKMSGERLRLALNYIAASQTDVKIPWPDGLAEQLDFSPERWADIVVAP